MKKPWFLMRCMALLQPLNNKNGGINAETIAVKNKSGNNPKYRFKQVCCP